jgi:hypothetical protein
VPGIGPSTADKILQTRKSYGAYKSVDDLLAIKGIGKNGWTKCASTYRRQNLAQQGCIHKASNAPEAPAHEDMRFRGPQALKAMEEKRRKKQAVPRALPKSVDA